MAATGTFLFNPEFAELVDDAFERAGIDPADVGARHIKSAARSAEFLFSDWHNRGAKQWTMVKYSLPLVAGTASYALPAGAYDIFHATFKDADGKETEMYPVSRSDYNSIYDKTVQGERPDRYFVDKSSFIGADPKSTIYLWQVPNTNAAGGTMEMWYMRRINDAGQPTATTTLDIPYHWMEAFTAGLAFKLAAKFNLERVAFLKSEYLGDDPKRADSHMPGGALGRALDADRETAPSVFRVRYDRGRR